MQGFVLFGMVITLVIGWLGSTLWLMVRAVRHLLHAALGRALATGALGCLVASAPWLTWAELQAIAAEQAKSTRVPSPLRVGQTEYAVEKAYGIGMPGDNETGFVVYRLDANSVDWLRHHQLQPPIVSPNERWTPTPVIAQRHSGPWHSYDDEHMGFDRLHMTSVEEYLDQYGYDVPVASIWLRRADHLINSKGSFYRYERGGAVTLMDPASGRVYFFYAG